MIKVVSIQVMGQTEKVEVNCPQCKSNFTYFTHPESRFTVRRICVNCGAILDIDLEATKDDVGY